MSFSSGNLLFLWNFCNFYHLEYWTSWIDPLILLFLLLTVLFSGRFPQCHMPIHLLTMLLWSFFLFLEKNSRVLSCSLFFLFFLKWFHVLVFWIYAVSYLSENINLKCSLPCIVFISSDLCFLLFWFVSNWRLSSDGWSSLGVYSYLRRWH